MAKIQNMGDEGIMYSGNLKPKIKKKPESEKTEPQQVEEVNDRQAEQAEVIDGLLNDLEETENFRQASAHYAQQPEYAAYASAARNYQELVQITLRDIARLESVIKASMGVSAPIIRWSAPDAEGHVVELEYHGQFVADTFKKMIPEVYRESLSKLIEVRKSLDILLKALVAFVSPVLEGGDKS